ncbi:MAG: hypothetical protein DRN12_01750 [Thermoplasmata archaeon]|nr:MAG: hypothetical protein DRN12_01750 [Thermoplasmata archaeon]HEC89641.1 TlpA family protein disulfide reductase [Thermoplasmatales archaeon]
MTRKRANKKSGNKKTPKKNNLKYGLILIVVLIIAAGGILALTSSNNANKPGEDFAFYDLNGNVGHLSDYRGKVVLLDMWATWCNPCRYQMLELRKAYQNYSHNKLEILSINIDSKETIQDIKDFIDTYAQYGYPLEWTFGKEKDSLDKYLKGGGIPTLCVFDQQGHLYFSKTGLTFFSKEDIPPNWTGDKTTLKEKIDELIT